MTDITIWSMLSFVIWPYIVVFSIYLIAGLTRNYLGR